MINNKSVLAITLARGGSKGIPKKNISPLFKIPSTINLAFTDSHTGKISRIKKENSVLEGFKEKNIIDNFYMDNQQKISTIY